jgi:hypothetical protein
MQASHEKLPGSRAEPGMPGPAFNALARKIMKSGKKVKPFVVKGGCGGVPE